MPVDDDHSWQRRCETADDCARAAHHEHRVRHARTTLVGFTKHVVKQFVDSIAIRSEPPSDSNGPGREGTITTDDGSSWSPDSVTPITIEMRFDLATSWRFVTAALSGTSHHHFLEPPPARRRLPELRELDRDDPPDRRDPPNPNELRRLLPLLLDIQP